MQIEDIRNTLRKQAVVFHTGGALPENTIKQSWIGQVNLGYAEETNPVDVNGQPMRPLMQLCLVDLPLIPNALHNTKLLTIFISSNFFEEPEGNFCVREYPSLEDLVEKDFGDSIEEVKACPLFPQLIENDYPQLVDRMYNNDIPRNLIDIIDRMWEEESIDYYDDIICKEDKEAKHKLGGYAEYCQCSVEFKAGYEFVLQIASDPDAELDIGDVGNIYFAKNLATNQWEADWDCY